MLVRLARFSVRRARTMVFAIWLPLLVVAGVAAQLVGSSFRTEFEIPASESTEVRNLLESAGADRSGFVAQVVFRAADGVNEPSVAATIDSLLDSLERVDGLTVVGPLDAPNQVSRDGTIAFAQLDLSVGTQGEAEELAEQIRELGDPLRRPGLEIEYGGNVFAEFELPASEAYGLLAAIVILVLAFGSVLAMGLPIGTALIGLGLGSSVVILASNVLPMPDFTTSLVAMIGLGVGIDYALFIVTRYREGLASGLDVGDAIVEAVDTSGRAVVFAGITVVISLMGLFVMGLSFARGMAMGAVIGVVTMVIASVSLLPALLVLVGRRIGTTTRAALAAMVGFVVVAFFAVRSESLSILSAAIAVALAVMSLSFLVRPMRVPLRTRTPKPRHETFWYRWSRLVQRRPWVSAISASVLLLVLAAPLTTLRLGFGDNGNAPRGSTVREAYDLLAEGFGPGFNGPLFVTVTGETAADPARLESFTRTVASLEGVVAANGTPISADGSLALIVAYPATAPQDEATSDLITRLRDEVIPASGVEAKVGGFTAVGVDFAAAIGGRLPWLFGSVLSLSFLLLLAVFRSLLVPLKAVVMNLLGIGAAYGVIVAIFQWGWGMGLVGVDKAGPIETWAPMMLFAIVFGLSMDYEVFLLSRIREEYDESGDNASAVADGLTATARVITAAALIMVCVFAAFVLGHDRQLKLFGLGLAVAVFLDATIIRMVLVPATMELLGDRNWWMPRWLDRIVPRIDVEGKRPSTP